MAIDITTYNLFGFNCLKAYFIIRWWERTFVRVLVWYHTNTVWSFWTLFMNLFSEILIEGISRSMWCVYLLFLGRYNLRKASITWLLLIIFFVLDYKIWHSNVFIIPCCLRWKSIARWTYFYLTRWRMYFMTKICAWETHGRFQSKLQQFVFLGVVISFYGQCIRLSFNISDILVTL